MPSTDTSAIRYAHVLPHGGRKLLEDYYNPLKMAFLIICLFQSDKTGADTPSEQSQPEVVAEPAAETKEAAVEVPSVAASENAVDANKKEESTFFLV